MTTDLSRRHLLHLMGLGAGAGVLNLGTAGLALAQDKDSVTIA